MPKRCRASFSIRSSEPRTAISAWSSWMRACQSLRTPSSWRMSSPVWMTLLVGTEGARGDRAWGGLVATDADGRIGRADAVPRLATQEILNDCVFEGMIANDHQAAAVAPE